MFPVMKRGFTLVELSIVLVIIGLLIGGILAAQSMISTAKVQATVRQVQQFNAAVNSFTTKFNCLPGDCKYAGSVNGNGDGMVGDYETNTDNDEYKIFWRQLYENGMAMNPAPSTQWYGWAPTTAGFHSPSSPINRRANYDPYGNGGVMAGGWSFQQLNLYSEVNCASPSWSSIGGTVPDWNAYVLNDRSGFWAGGNAVVKAADAAAIDSKIDDGKPLTGNTLAYNAYTSSATCGAGYPSLRAASCTSGNNYTFTDSNYCTNMLIKAEFVN